jgi:hypothetical protein
LNFLFFVGITFGDVLNARKCQPEINEIFAKNVWKYLMELNSAVNNNLHNISLPVRGDSSIKVVIPSTNFNAPFLQQVAVTVGLVSKKSKLIVLDSEDNSSGDSSDNGSPSKEETSEKPMPKNSPTRKRTHEDDTTSDKTLEKDAHGGEKLKKNQKGKLGALSSTSFAEVANSRKKKKEKKEKTDAVDVKPKEKRRKIKV